jgi:hypothetical protein
MRILNAPDEEGDEIDHFGSRIWFLYWGKNISLNQEDIHFWDGQIQFYRLVLDRCYLLIYNWSSDTLFSTYICVQTML